MRWQAVFSVSSLSGVCRWVSLSIKEFSLYRIVLLADCLYCEGIFLVLCFVVFSVRLANIYIYWIIKLKCFQTSILFKMYVKHFRCIFATSVTGTLLMLYVVCTKKCLNRDHIQRRALRIRTSQDALKTFFFILLLIKLFLNQYFHKRTSVISVQRCYSEQ